MNELKVTFEVNDAAKARALLESTMYIHDLESVEGNTLVFALSSEKIPALNKYLVENNIEVSAVIPARSLEEYFLNITEKAS